MNATVHYLPRRRAPLPAGYAEAAGYAFAAMAVFGIGVVLAIAFVLTTPRKKGAE